jgi:hypothetical protein
MNAPPATSPITVDVNGARRTLAVGHRTSLPGPLRERLDLTGAPPGKCCAPHVGCTPSRPLVRAGATDCEELAILTRWTARAAVTLNLCHWAGRPAAALES